MHHHNLCLLQECGRQTHDNNICEVDEESALPRAKPVSKKGEVEEPTLVDAQPVRVVHGRKRSRGRRGLDVIAQLQREPRLDVTIDETAIPGKSVDQMLLELARRTNAIIVTTDTALSRVSNIHDVPVLSMHQSMVHDQRC